MGLFSRARPSDAIVARIREMEPGLREQGADALYIFGSKADGDSRPGSDLDLLVDDAAAGLSLPQLAAINELVGDELDLNVHITTRASLDAAARSDIDARATRIF